jgi:hypothetical protein
MTIKELATTVETLSLQVEQLTQKLDSLSAKKGPASTREMSLEDAERIINGDLREVSHKIAAEKLGLSYGQIYSARGGYTFKNVARNK